MTNIGLEKPAFDLESLLAPIPGDSPTGQPLRFDPLYEEISRLREEEEDLPQGVWEKPRKRADWPAVIDRATTALTTRTKDLQIAAWLAEAWLHQYQFAGLDHGMRLLSSLCLEYWDKIHPLPDGENLQPRMAPLEWASINLALPIKQVPITAPAGENESPYRWLDAELTLHEENLAKVKATPAEPSVVTHPKFLVSVSLTPAEWYAARAADIGGALKAIDALEDVLTQLAGEATAPSFAQLRTPLTAIQQFVSRTLAGRVQSGELAPWAVGEHAPPFEGPDLDAPRRGAPIGSRAEAFQRLREAAEYLMRTEPHSPVPYLVRRAVSWEHMSLSELLEELLAKNPDLAAIDALLGIKRP